VLAFTTGVLGECGHHPQSHFLVQNRNPGVRVVSKPETEPPSRPPKSASLAKFLVSPVATRNESYYGNCIT